MIEVSCDAEDVIISQGEDGDHFYLVDSGAYIPHKALFETFKQHRA